MDSGATTLAASTSLLWVATTPASLRAPLRSRSFVCGNLDLRQEKRASEGQEGLVIGVGTTEFEKSGMTWPLEPEGARRFCEGLEDVLVVEEKRPLVEEQLARLRSPDDRL
jgi:hypothetical protein